MAAKPPEHHHHHHNHRSPAVAPMISSLLLHQPIPSREPIDFSPPLIAMVVVAAAAFLVVSYSRLISRHLYPPFHRLNRRYTRWRRRRLRPPSDIESLPPPPYDSSDGFYVYSPYGLDDSVIKNIPLAIYKLPKQSKNSSSSFSSISSKLGLSFIDDDEFRDCAVCLLEFDDGDYVRTLPLCSHAFHVDCIDVWLRSHATCPLCRAGVLVASPEPPFTPVMAARIRPSLDETLLLESVFLEPLVEENSGEIQPARSSDLFSPGRITQSEDHRRNRRELDFLLKRSYSFGFERNFPSERLNLEPATTPYHHHRRRRSFFWTKRQPSSSSSSTPVTKTRAFSFRRTVMKSPSFFRRRSFFPASESHRFSIPGGSSRRMKMMSSPIIGTAAMFTSSRMRCGDPEALLSPERYHRR